MQVNLTFEFKMRIIRCAGYPLFFHLAVKLLDLLLKGEGCRDKWKPHIWLAQADQAHYIFYTHRICLFVHRSIDVQDLELLSAGLREVARERVILHFLK